MTFSFKIERECAVTDIAVEHFGSRIKQLMSSFSKLYKLMRDRNHIMNQREIRP